MAPQLSKPLSYPSQECVFQQMEANKRFQTASCCAALRMLHKKNPAKIDELKITDTWVAVNGTVHNLYSHVIDLRNSIDETFQYDIYNYVTQSTDLELKEQDFGLDPLWPQGAGFIEQYLEKQLKNSEPKFKVFVRYHSTIMPRKVESPDGVKMRDVIRSLLNLLVPSNLFVRSLVIPIREGVIRVPENYRIRISELKIRTEKVPGFLDPASFPLTRVSVEVDARRGPLFLNPIFQHTVLQKAKILEIDTDFVHHLQPGYIHTITRFENPIIHLYVFKNPHTTFSSIYRVWLENPRKLGAKLSMETPYNLSLFEQALARLDGVPAVIASRTFPPFRQGSTRRLGENLELNVYGWKNPNNEEEKWRIVMEVMEQGSATPVDIEE